MDAINTSQLAGIFVLSYLLGSIPFGLVVTRLFTSVDIRQHGSGNIGATNVRRLAGTRLGLLTLAGDVLKGTLPVYLAGIAAHPDMSGREVYISVVAFSAFVGHLYPLYLKFKGGGKGVATAFGCMLMVSPMAVVLALLAFLLIAWRSNRVSAGSLAAAAVLSPAVWWTTREPSYAVCALLIAVFIFVRHRDNIRRLVAGTEPGFRSRPPER